MVKIGGKIHRMSVLFARIVVALCVGIFLLVHNVSFADTMSSTNFRVQNDSLNVGGGNSSSASFIADDALGELATGEELTSTNFRACNGFECFERIPYLLFTVKEGTSSPGTAGAGVDLGTITTSAVTTSNGTTVNSIFLTTETNAISGVSVTVTSLYGALQRTANPLHTIPSSTATLVAGTAGYGICVASTTEASGSPTALTEVSPYNGSCSSGAHDVGIVDSTSRTVVTATGEVKSGTAEIMVKAAASPTSTVEATDYTDSLTFIASATF